MKKTIVISFLFTHFLYFSQEKYPQNYFSNPLEIPILLSGSFGELRSNHFHSGLDIKTQGREGLKVIAAAEGYISRIKVQQFGYGKAIYITHPSGFTTVYGHLSKFADEIEAYIKSVQYKNESYETGDLFFNEDQFPVQKGEIIAFSGDTGGSGGPHLHFEIRNSFTEKAINPLFFGLKVKDTIPPTFQNLKVFALSDYSRINQQNKSFQLTIKNTKKGVYEADRISANGIIGFGVNVFDRFNNSSNKNGIFSLELLVNGKRYFYHDVETFSFEESKYINLFMDYEHYKKYHKKYQKTFKEPENNLSTYKDLINNGEIDIKEGLNYTIDIIAKDYEGNMSSLKIPIIGTENNSIITEQKDTTAYKIIAANFNKFKLENVTIAFPKNTFYKDVFLDFKVENGIAKIHTPTIPLHKIYTLTFDVTKYSQEERKHLYIANLEYPKYPRYQLTRKKEKTFYTTTKYLGNYTLLSDHQKPSIKLLYFKDNQSLENFKTLKVKIADIGSDIKNYSATIDDEWILMEFNHKKNILTYNFSDKKLVGSKHIFKIVVSDNAGNTNELSATFFKKQVN